MDSMISHNNICHSIILPVVAQHIHHQLPCILGLALTVVEFEVAVLIPKYLKEIFQLVLLTKYLRT